jgi:uncharacterized iron-regulated protein
VLTALDSVETIDRSKAQKVADKLNEEVIFITKGVQHIQVQAGTAYQLNAKDFDAKKFMIKSTIFGGQRN